MGTVDRISLRIRKRETPFYDLVYKIAKRIRGFSIPCINPLHSFLYWERIIRTDLWHNFWRTVYYEPIFKSQCKMVGKNFTMAYAGNGTTRILGSLDLYFGDNVTIFDNTSFAGLKLFDNPSLHVGNSTYIGPLVRIFVASKIRIGNHSLIGSALITDNPGHSIDVLERLKGSGGVPSLHGVKPVNIGDFCWLPLETVVYPGVTIGDGVVAKMATHVNRDVPPFCLIAGQPFRIIRKLPIPPELKAIVGEERYESYLAAHADLDI
jgi:acetyltransferase-like isoleucine patch superfamily enzyme